MTTYTHSANSRKPEAERTSVGVPIGSPITEEQARTALAVARRAVRRYVRLPMASRDDLTGAALLAIAEGAPRYSETESGSWGAWCSVVARRAAADYHRRIYRTRTQAGCRVAIESDLLSAGVPSAEGPVERASEEDAGVAEFEAIDEQIAKRGRLRRLLRLCTKRQRESLWNYYVEGTPQFEIAAARGISPASVSINCARGIDRLRSKLQAHKIHH